MKKSIEEIWQDNKLDVSKNITPRIDAIYQKRSNLLVARIGRFVKAELILLCGIAVVCISALIFFRLDVWFVLLAVVSFLVWLYLGFSQLSGLQATPLQTNSYHYLIEVQRKLRAFTGFNKNLTLMMVFLLISPLLINTYLLNQDKTLGEIFGWGGIAGNPVLIFLILPISLFIAHSIFRWYVNTGERYSSKLSGMIQEMESL